jgi:hypothetical protein
MRLLCTNCWGGIVDYHRAKAGHRTCADCERMEAELGAEAYVNVVADLDPELAQADPEAAAAAGRYLAQSMRRGVSDVWRTGGREMYRNRAGRCEDAPCCGCCNA